MLKTSSSRRERATSDDQPVSCSATVIEILHAAALVGCDDGVANAPERRCKPLLALLQL